MENVEKRMTTDLLEAKQRGPEKAVLEQVEQYQQEILKERFAEMLKSRHFPSALKKTKQKTCVFVHVGIRSSAYARKVKH